MDLLNLKFKSVDPRETIPAEEIFGTEADRMHEVCKKVLHHALHPYEGCKTPNYAEIKAIKAELVANGAADTSLRAARSIWLKRNPAEAEEIEASHRAWEAERDRQFRIAFGIAKRHNLYLKWHGKSEICCCPDMWEVYKGREPVARICMM